MIAAAVAAWITAQWASKDLVVKRQLEATQSFLELVETLDNRAEREVGLGKQIATGWLIAQFGRTNQFLRRTSIEVLEHYREDYQESAPPLAAALNGARSWLGKEGS